MSGSDVSLQPGTRVDDRYEIIEYIGGGGMGTVYKARELSLDRLVALKLLHPSSFGDTDGLARFEREGQVISLLQHRNIPTFYRFAIWQNQYPYIAMEYLGGTSLESELASCGRIAWQRLVRIIKQICLALEHTHVCNVIHRDLKPANVILCPSADEPDFIKVIDFGLARLLPQPSGSVEKLTQTGLLVGSIHYMSPEQCLGGVADSRSDIYSLGCVAYQCLSGKQPFDSENPIALLHQHVNESASPLSKLIPGLPPGLEALVFKCMAKQPADRYQSAGELRADLELVEAGRGDECSAQPLAAARSRRSRAVWSHAVVAAATGLTLLTVAFIWLYPPAMAWSSTCLLGGLCRPEDRPFETLRVATRLSEMGQSKAANLLLDDLLVVPAKNSPLPRQAQHKLSGSPVRPSMELALARLQAHLLRVKFSLQNNRDDTSRQVIETLGAYGAVGRLPDNRVDELGKFTEELIVIVRENKIRLSKFSLSHDGPCVRDALVILLVNGQGKTAFRLITELLDAHPREDAGKAELAIYAAGCCSTREGAQWWIGEAIRLLKNRCSTEQAIVVITESLDYLINRQFYEEAYALGDILLEQNLPEQRWFQVTVRLAQLKMVTGDYRGAVELCRRGLDGRSSPISIVKNIMARINLWSILVQSEFHLHNQQAVSAAIDQATKELDTACYQTDFQLDQKELRSARLTLAQCCVSVEQFHRVEPLLALTFKQTRVPNATQELRLARLEAIVVLMQTCLQTHKVEKAAQVFEETKELHVDEVARPTLLVAAFQLQMGKGNLDEADRLITEMKKELPGPNYWNPEMWLRYEQKKYGKCKEVAEVILQNQSLVASPGEVLQASEMLDRLKKL